MIQSLAEPPQFGCYFDKGYTFIKTESGCSKLPTSLAKDALKLQSYCEQKHCNFLPYNCEELFFSKTY